MTEISKDNIFSYAGILIVDDEPMVRDLFSIACKQAGFKSVFTAPDGFDALKLLLRHADEIDLLSLDLMMPGMDGLKLAETVANTHSRIVGIVMVTGFETAEFKDAFFSIKSETGLSEEFLSKPVGADKLLESYKNALTDVFAKRECQVELEVTVAAKEVKRALASQFLVLTEIQQRLTTFNQDIVSLKENVRNLADRTEPKASADLSYVLVLALLFLIVTAALVWASTYLPVLSVLALASVTVLVLMLIAVFDLSKGGKLSERSLMEVLRLSFRFIGRWRK